MARDNSQNLELTDGGREAVRAMLARRSGATFAECTAKGFSMAVTAFLETGYPPSDETCSDTRHFLRGQIERKNPKMGEKEVEAETDKAFGEWYAFHETRHRGTEAAYKARRARLYVWRTTRTADGEEIGAGPEELTAWGIEQRAEIQRQVAAWIHDTYGALQHDSDGRAVGFGKTVKDLSLVIDVTNHLVPSSSFRAPLEAAFAGLK